MVMANVAFADVSIVMSVVSWTCDSVAAELIKMSWAAWMLATPRFAMEQFAYELTAVVLEKLVQVVPPNVIFVVLVPPELLLLNMPTIESRPLSPMMLAGTVMLGPVIVEVEPVKAP